MNDLMDNLAIGTATVGSAITAFFLAVAYYLPKLMNTNKGDRLDGKVLDRVEALEEKTTRMSETIHLQAIKLTRLTIILLHIKPLLVAHAVPVPEHIQKDIDEFTNEDA